jgi:hypothetical protein
LSTVTKVCKYISEKVGKYRIKSILFDLDNMTSKEASMFHSDEMMKQLLNELKAIEKTPETTTMSAEYEAIISRKWNRSIVGHISSLLACTTHIDIFTMHLTDSSINQFFNFQNPTGEVENISPHWKICQSIGLILTFTLIFHYFRSK